MDDFEAFRKKRQRQKQAEQEAKRVEEAGDEVGWTEGLGPQGPKNPKVKGFVLGRYWQPKKIDPNQLEKPKGYERTRLTREPPPTDRKEKSDKELKKTPKQQIKGFRKF